MSTRKKSRYIWVSFSFWFGSNLIQYTLWFQVDTTQWKWHFPWGYREAFVHTNSSRDQPRNLKTAHAKALPGQLFCEIPSKQVQHKTRATREASAKPIWHFSECLTSPEMLCGTACLLPCSNSPAAQVQVHGLRRGNRGQTNSSMNKGKTAWCKRPVQ